MISEAFFIWNEKLTKKTATRLISSRALDLVQKSPDLFVAGSVAPKVHGRSQDHAPTKRWMPKALMGMKKMDAQRGGHWTFK